MTDFLTLETEVDLQRLVAEGIEESLVLDYKASAALSKDNGKVNELCKDVSAFANSAGGQIVYGIAEKKDKNGAPRPDRVDGGVTDPALNREWLENLLLTRIQPRIDGLDIKPIRLAAGGTAYVLSIPQAMSRAPHQANHSYSKRYNFSSVPMADYEVRDAMKRASAPDLTCEFSISSMPKIEFPHGDKGQSSFFSVSFAIGNHSPVPAEHVIATLFHDRALFPEVGASFNDPAQTRWAVNGEHLEGRTQIVSPRFALPIFKEHPYALGLQRFRFIAFQTLGRSHFYLGIKLFWPGGTYQKMGVLHLQNDRVSLSFD